MTLEQKAKSYDEAIERAKKQLDGAKVFDYKEKQIAHDIRTIVYCIFPELKHRVVCEANCTTTKEWSEEDALQLNEAIEAVNESSYSLKRKDVVIDWLKSLKCRYTWKPSDEQMKAIRLARSFVTDDYFSDNPTLSEILIELENQLKKLREE